MTTEEANEPKPAPPPGFEVFRSDELDPDYGFRDRWVFMGMIGNRSVIRGGFTSFGSASRAAWAVASRAATTRGEEPPPEPKPEPKRYKPRWTKPPEMRDEYTVKVGTWDRMLAGLVSQIIADAGSLRRAAKILFVPRSTLSARVRDLIAHGAWPTVKGGARQ